MTSTLRDAVEELDSLYPPFSVARRGFVQTSLGAGFAAAVLPVMAQTMITTDTQGLTAGEVKIPTKDGEMPAYRAMPAGKTGLATVLVVSEIFGVHEYIKDVSRRLAKQGYLAIAPELFARQGDAGKYTDIGALMKEIVSKTSDAQVLGDLRRCVRMGRQKWRWRQTWHYRILLGWTRCADVCRAQSESRSRGRLVRCDGAQLLLWRQDRTRRGGADQGADPWFIRCGRWRHSE